MKRSTLMAIFIILAAGPVGYQTVLASFTSRGTVTVAASATVGTGGSSAPAQLTITAQGLPSVAFFGDNVVIPVTVTNVNGPITTQGLSVEIFYQVISPNGGATAPGYTNVPVPMEQDSISPNVLNGAAIIPRDNVTGLLHGGQLQYYFVASQTNAAAILGGDNQTISFAGSNPPAPSNPFIVISTDTWSSAVSPAGSIVAVPNTYVGGGQTAVHFSPGALTAPGLLIIHQDDPVTFARGPNGALADAIYTFTLEGTSLFSTAQLTLSYPADVDGTVLPSHDKPTNLAPYYLDPAYGWTLLGRPQIDTTLDTVTALTTHVSTFALFATGPIGAADIRPTQRIITPNGDGINDTAVFSGLAIGEDVHIFDVRGRRVRTLKGPSPVWDGRDDEGAIVPSGVYIYQYTSQGQRVSGVIGVAK